MAVLLLFQAVSLWAAAPLAMRVTVQPTAITSNGTVMALNVQVAPQDRGRIGRQARMRIKLNEGTQTLFHVLSDIDFDDGGTTRAEFTWPPGIYQLTLTIESLRGTAQGLWVGDVDVPENLNHVPPAAQPGPEFEPLTPEKNTPPPDSSPKDPSVAAGAAAAAVVVESPPVVPANPQAEAQNDAAPTPSTPESMATATAEPAPRQTHISDPVPQIQPDPSRTSGPVYALVLDIDPSDLEITDRTADLRASIDRRAENVTPIVFQGGESNPAEALMQGLDLVRSHPDARAIIVITDARDKASRSQWKTANASIESADLRVFVIALWNDEFNPGTRKQLSLLATKSGGRSYVLQPAESPSRALEMLDPLLSAHTTAGEEK